MVEGGHRTPATRALPPPDGPGEGWLRVMGLLTLVLMLALDAFVDDFDPNEALYVPLIGGAVVGNEIWAWVNKKKG